MYLCTQPTGSKKKSGSTIQHCLSDSILLNVSGKYSFLKLWNNIGSLYQSKNPSKQVVSSKEDVSPQDGWQWQSDGSSKFIQYPDKSITYVGIKMEE